MLRILCCFFVGVLLDVNLNYVHVLFKLKIHEVGLRTGFAVRKM